MSWVFGYIGNLDASTKKLIQKFINSPEIICDRDELFIAGGGDTSTYHFLPELNSLALGFGILDEHTNYKWMNKQDWEHVILNNSLKTVEGHYLLIKWSKSDVCFISDPVGLRTVYFYKTKNVTFFSTKIKLITELIEYVEINFTEFGAKWLLYNKFSFSHFIEGLEKLPPGSVAVISLKGIEYTPTGYIAEKMENNTDDLIHQIIKLLRIKLNNGYKISFGLSGGLDSRFLLSILLKENIEFELHTFGYDDDPDVIIAKKVAQELGLKINHIKSKYLFDEEFISEVMDYASGIELVEPVSTYIKLETLNNQYFKDKIILDGALAEIARRQLLNKLVYFGKNELKNKNAEGILKYFTASRPVFFKKPFYDKMYKGAIQDLNRIFLELPDFKDSSVENFADLLVFKYKVPNGIGLEQARLDQFVLSLMPFGQMKTFDICQSIPVSAKTNSKILYNYIDEYAPVLAKIPLVKAGLTYPYKSSTIKAQLLRRYKSFFGIEKNLDKVNFYNSIKHIVLETLSEDKIKKYEPYDMDKVSEIVNGFYGGNPQYADSLDWLFSFEIFRNKLIIN